MIYRNEQKESVLNAPLAKGYRLAALQQHELVELLLEVGGEVPLHSLPLHVTFYVIDGIGTLIIEDKTFEASTGDVLEVASNLQRGWRNTGNKALKLLVIKSIE